MASGDALRTPPPVVAVIPTIGATHLGAAVQSALDQTYPQLQVVVSVDGPVSGLAEQLPRDPRVRVVSSSERLGPRAARAAAIAVADAEYVAFLDDDDRWHPDKISRQIAVAEATRAAGARNVVVLCRMNLVDEEGQMIQTVPRRLLRPGDRMADYLFVRREIRPGEAVVAASMALLSRAAAEVASATQASFLHEDWEALLDLAGEPGTAIVMLDDVLVDYRVHPSGGSASSRMTWRLSQDWFDQHREELTAREWADGLLCVTAVLAAAQRDRRGALRVARSAHAARAASWRAWAFFLASLTVPPRLARVLTRALGTSGRRAAARTRRS